MLVKARMGVSLDGYVATPDGLPALLTAPDFVPGLSHGYPDFVEGCDAVVMGRSTFLPALGAPRWPWPGLRVYVLTSAPLPPETPGDVTVVPDGPAAMARRLRSRGSDADVHLAGGPRTIAAFWEIGALDRLEIVWLPLVAGDGTPLFPAGSPQRRLRQSSGPRTFPDGSVEVGYTPA